MVPNKYQFRSAVPLPKIKTVTVRYHHRYPAAARQRSGDLSLPPMPPPLASCRRQNVEPEASVHLQFVCRVDGRYLGNLNHRRWGDGFRSWEVRRAARLDSVVSPARPSVIAGSQNVRCSMSRIVLAVLMAWTVVQAQQTSLALVDVSVVPMDRQEVLEHRTVIVRNGRIAAIGESTSVRIPAEALQVDGRGKFL